MILDYPKLRPLEAISVQENIIMLRDPKGFSDKILLISPETLNICILLDGKHKISEIQTEYTKEFGINISKEKIKEVINHLDDSLFLDSNRYQEVRRKIIKEFKESHRRPAAHAGQAYEADPDRLKEQLDGFFISEEGPGVPLGLSESGKLKGLIAPHIDIRRGGMCFAESYACLARECKAKIFVILGIAHSATETTYILTDKNFETPFGLVNTNTEVISYIKNKCKYNLLKDEFEHKREHSVEFQILFLKYLYSDKKDISIIPVLCSAMHENIMTGLSPYHDPGVKEFIDALREVKREYGEDVCFIAGVDFSHIGQLFGQNIQITDEIVNQLKQNDKFVIDSILEGDPEAFIKIIHKQRDRTNICGIPAIYTLLKVLEPEESKFLMYDQAIDKNTQSIVSFSGIGFY